MSRRSSENENVRKSSINDNFAERVKSFYPKFSDFAFVGNARVTCKFSSRSITYVYDEVVGEFFDVNVCLFIRLETV